jgi:hypothetical protein
MRGDDQQSDAMFQLHRARAARSRRPPAAADPRHGRRSARSCPRVAQLYPRIGRPSIPSKKLLRGLLLQFLYSVRSERQLMERLDYNLLFRWFVRLRPPQNHA